MLICFLLFDFPVSWVYPQEDIDSNLLHDRDYLVGRAILTPRNKEVQEINSKVMQIFRSRDGSQAQKLHASDSLSLENPPEAAAIYPTELMESSNISGLPPATLELKIGSIVMLLRNMNGARGQANGTRAIVCRICRKVIELEIATGTNVGDWVLIPRVVLDASMEETGLPFSFRRRQFPIRPAFAMPIIKSQGQTMQKVGVHLPDPVFAHGQLYVALSRVGSPNAIKVLVKGVERQHNTFASIAGTPLVLYNDEAYLRTRLLHSQPGCVEGEDGPSHTGILPVSREGQHPDRSRIHAAESRPSPSLPSQEATHIVGKSEGSHPRGGGSRSSRKEKARRSTSMGRSRAPRSEGR
jgi:hypothetical protein